MLGFGILTKAILNKNPLFQWSILPSLDLNHQYSRDERQAMGYLLDLLLVVQGRHSGYHRPIFITEKKTKFQASA